MSPRRPVIRVGGASAAMELVRQLATAYPERTDVEFVYQRGLYSAGAIQGVGFGDLDIGGVARNLTASERASRLELTPLANDGLAVVANPTAGIHSLESKQVKQLYAGRYRNWREVGGANMPIILLDRGEDHSAKMALRKYVIGKTRVLGDAVPLYYEEDMVDGIQTTPGAFGFVSLGYVMSQRMEVTVIELDGVTPSVQNVKSGAYRPARTIGVVIRPDADEDVRKFVEWASGADAAHLMEKKGFAAIRPAKN